MKQISQVLWTGRRTGQPWRLATGATVAGLAVAAVAVSAAGPWDFGQRTAERDRAVALGRTGGVHHRAAAPDEPGEPAPAPSAPGVLSAPRAPVAASGAIAPVLEPLMGDPGLGPVLTASVVDLTTGKQVYGKNAGSPMAPASTIKIATAVAALSATGPTHRIPTTVVAAPDHRTVTLVGGGDPTLDQVRLGALADGTARALREHGVSTVRVTYETSLYRGPVLHPIGANDNIAPVTPLMLDEGRLDGSTRGPADRAEDPAQDAAAAFVSLLGKRGINTETGPDQGKRPAKAVTVARTLSLPMSALVERMLTNSDNDIAEALARQTAIADGRPASFAGGQAAVTARLKRLKLPVANVRLADGSGLNRADRVSAALLTGLLARAADPAHPELRSVLTGLPVAGFTGTLTERSQARTAGLVRAKTGSLTGVDTLAGTAVSADGRLLAFAFMAGETPFYGAGRPALDRMASALIP
ncbi:D-alanyl-D-alanine carboxypeptidase/D-alanyl-D-alanine-endopeptidase [Streptomyces sp. SCSIO 30461]|uniref:D-alanyl-D-alanine carboxypeptidase/D-alanyl-D-alanine endopeptidase n=1 Tax=Streptomyces sp. SCSIO 30461 TaxID=3118085 RepID=UPI00387E4EB3